MENNETNHEATNVDFPISYSQTMSFNPTETSRHWVVQQDETGAEAELLGLMWSPKKKTNGHASKWYNNMSYVQPGDYVYSYRDKCIHAYGKAKTKAVTAFSPFSNNNSNSEGWLIEIDFIPLKFPFSISENYDFFAGAMTEDDKVVVRRPGETVIIGYLKEVSPAVSALFHSLGMNSQVKSDVDVKKEVVEEIMEIFKLLGEELCLPPSFLSEISELLDDKSQVIFYGPPGTGKTYTAMKLAEALGGSSDSVELIQFHPSYAYEDFVEGFRPIEDGTFKIRSGKLLSFAERAKSNPNKKYFLIIDEINRGNLSKIFGEMYFLLEYRNQEIQLQYSSKQFKMPKNLHFIGTMNSADRSVGLIDSALRRRFHFVSFYPTTDAMKNLLRNWLAKNAPEMEWLADIVDMANKKLQNPDFAIGPSHFMKLGIDESLATKIWDRSILPYVEDFYFNRKENVSEFELDRLRSLKRIAPPHVELSEEHDAEAQAS